MTNCVFKELVLCVDIYGKKFFYIGRIMCKFASLFVVHR